MKTVAVICGGDSGEYDISIQSGRVVVDSLPQEKFKGYLVVIKKTGWQVEFPDGQQFPVMKEDFSFVAEGVKVTFDLVFNAIHGTPGEDGKILGYFDVLGIPYTSSNMLVSALTFNKDICKRVVASHGVRVAKSVLLKKDHHINAQILLDTLGLPVFVKPNNGGSSVGVTKVKQPDQLLPAVYKAMKEDDEVLVESFIGGREFGCGVMQSKKGMIVFPVTEIISKNEFFDYEAKYTQGMADEVTPAQITETAETRIKSTAAFLFESLGCKGFVRFDFIISKGKLYFLEVNTVPGITQASILPKQANEMGIGLADLFEMALDNIIDQ
jgi:D-alanine-D-alanine ligase